MTHLNGCSVWPEGGRGVWRVVRVVLWRLNQARGQFGVALGEVSPGRRRGGQRGGGAGQTAWPLRPAAEPAIADPESGQHVCGPTGDREVRSVHAGDPLR
jgi:hypothetical protein